MLTDSQLADVRRYCGYPLAGTSMTITDDQDTVYMRFGMVVMSLHKRLTTLSASEESILVTNYLANLATLETAILGAGDNLDTDVAAVWTRNKNEMSDRVALFDMWRRRLCGFLGLAPGPALGDGSMRLMRA